MIRNLTPFERSWFCSFEWDIHTYMLRSLRHTYIHSYFLGPVRHTYIHAQGSQTYIHTRLEPSWAPGSTPPHNSKKNELNVRFWRLLIRNLTPSETSRFCSFEWDIHTYMLRSLRHTYIHTCLCLSDIHTYMLRVLRHTYIHTRCMPGVGGPQTSIHTYTLRALRHTYIHTYRHGALIRTYLSGLLRCRFLLSLTSMCIPNN